MKRPKPPELEPLQQLGVVPVNYDTYVNELEEYIDHLEAKAENLPISDVTQWVAVDDRLPREQGRYVVCIKRNGQTHLDLVTWSTILKNWDYDYLHPITFWMEKPEPPCG